MNKLLIFTDPMDLAHKASHWLEEKATQVGAKKVYLPAGHSPEPIYQYWSEKHPDFLSSLEFYQVDDIETGTQKGLFKNYFETHLPFYKDRMTWVTEKKVQADLAILGFGINGHVAFHEPHISRDWYWGDVMLSQETKDYLGLEEGTMAKTYGLKAFLETKAILLIVAGIKKKQVFEKFMKDDNALPATALKEHKDLTILVESLLLEP